MGSWGHDRIWEREVVDRIRRGAAAPESYPLYEGAISQETGERIGLTTGVVYYDVREAEDRTLKDKEFRDSLRAAQKAAKALAAKEAAERKARAEERRAAQAERAKQYAEQHAARAAQRAQWAKEAEERHAQYLLNQSRAEAERLKLRQPRKPDSLEPLAMHSLRRQVGDRTQGSWLSAHLPRLREDRVGQSPVIVGGTVKVMILYCLPPIDQWSGWQKPSEVFSGEKENVDSHQASDWDDLWKQVQSFALEMDWEGDIREGPYVTVLPRGPADYWPAYVVIAWKQDNNGTTFLASPIHLSWLENGWAEWREF